MVATVKIHGGARFAGNDPGVANFELEELASDPTTFLGVGRMWINTTTNKVRCVTALDASGNPIINNILDSTDALTIASTNIGKVYAGNVVPMTATTTIPYSNTQPTITQGTQIVSQAVTPIDNTSHFLIDFTGLIDTATQGEGVVITAWRSVVGQPDVMVGYSLAWVQHSGSPIPLSIQVADVPATADQITYSLRVGSTSGAWYLGEGQNYTMGGQNSSGWTIMELRT